MQSRLTISGIFLLCLLCALAGCTGTQNTATTTVPTAPAEVSPAAVVTAGADLVPSPTDSIIEANRVNVNVEKDHLGNIIVTFQGGSGLQLVNRIDVTLNRADGRSIPAEVGINVGDTVTMEGTKNTDRVVVFVTMKDGKRYKIHDSLVPYKARL